MCDYLKTRTTILIYLLQFTNILNKICTYIIYKPFINKVPMADKNYFNYNRKNSITFIISEKQQKYSIHSL